MTVATNGRRTQAELAAEHGVSTRTIRRWAKSGQATAPKAATNGHTPAPTPVRPARSSASKVDVLDRYGRPIVGWAVTVLALVFSYSRMRHLAELAGVSWPQLAPLLVDGLLATAVLCLRRNRDYWPARFALALSVIAGVALNVLAERPDLVAMEDIRLWWALMIPATAAFGVHLVLKR